MKVEDLIGRRIAIPEQFTAPVTVESAEIVEDTIILSVRTLDGSSQEALLEIDRLPHILAAAPVSINTLVNADSFFLYMETNRIKNAFAYDPYFAVSLSGVRPLPHQLEAVYERILPQVRLRFLLAYDPGAGKTIMTGLLIKELKLRHIIDLVLILTPAPLTFQCQDELESKFTETFEVIDSSRVKNQLVGNPWERSRQCITSIDFAKCEEILPGILQVDWDLVIIDESHKCSA
jgi:SNF2 family DNA or RNA helicase